MLAQSPSKKCSRRNQHQLLRLGSGTHELVFRVDPESRTVGDLPLTNNVGLSAACKKGEVVGALSIGCATGRPKPITRFHNAQSGQGKRANQPRRKREPRRLKGDEIRDPSNLAQREHPHVAVSVSSLTVAQSGARSLKLEPETEAFERLHSFGVKDAPCYSGSRRRGML